MKELNSCIKSNAKVIYIVFFTSFILTIYPDTSKSYEYKEVYNAQLKLKELNYDTGNIDGLFGVKTRQSVCKFQKDNSLTVTCKLDELTINILNKEYSKINKYSMNRENISEKIKIIKNNTNYTISYYKDVIEKVIKSKRCNLIFMPFHILYNTGSIIEYIIIQCFKIAHYFSSEKLEYKTIAFYTFALSPLAIASISLSKETGDPIFIKIFNISLAFYCVSCGYIIFLRYFSVSDPSWYIIHIPSLCIVFIYCFIVFLPELLPYIIGIVAYAVVCILTILFSIKAYESIGHVYHKITSIDYLAVYNHFNELDFDKGLAVLFSIMLIIIDAIYLSTAKRRSSIKGAVVNIQFIYIIIWIAIKNISLLVMTFVIFFFDIYLAIYFLYWNKIKRNIQFKLRSFLRNTSFKYKYFSFIEFNIVILPHFFMLSLVTYIMFYHPWIFRGVPIDRTDLSLFVISTFYFFSFQYIAIAIISYFTIYKLYIDGENMDDPDLGIPEPIDYLLSP